MSVHLTKLCLSGRVDRMVHTARPRVTGTYTMHDSEHANLVLQRDLLLECFPFTSYLPSSEHRCGALLPQLMSPRRSHSMQQEHLSIVFHDISSILSSYTAHRPDLESHPCHTAILSPTTNTEDVKRTSAEQNRSLYHASALSGG